MIAAMGSNREIGYQGDIPWGLTMKTDMRRFVKLTKGNTIIMGRKTFESLPSALPNRQNIVLTRSPDLQLPGCELALTLPEAVSMADPDREIFVIGGQQIYEMALEYTDVIHISVIHHDFVADTYFPEYGCDPLGWFVVHSEEIPTSESDAYSHRYQILHARV